MWNGHQFDVLGEAWRGRVILVGGSGVAAACGSGNTSSARGRSVPEKDNPTGGLAGPHRRIREKLTWRNPAMVEAAGTLTKLRASDMYGVHLYSTVDAGAEGSKQASGPSRLDQSWHPVNILKIPWYDPPPLDDQSLCMVLEEENPKIGTKKM